MLLHKIIEPLAQSIDALCIGKIHLCSRLSVLLLFQPTYALFVVSYVVEHRLR
jgi:hypothetical protein